MCQQSMLPITVDEVFVNMHTVRVGGQLSLEEAIQPDWHCRLPRDCGRWVRGGRQLTSRAVSGVRGCRSSQRCMGRGGFGRVLTVSVVSKGIGFVWDRGLPGWQGMLQSGGQDVHPEQFRDGQPERFRSGWGGRSSQVLPTGVMG